MIWKRGYFDIKKNLKKCSNTLNYANYKCTWLRAFKRRSKNHCDLWFVGLQKWTFWVWGYVLPMLQRLSYSALHSWFSVWKNLPNFFSPPFVISYLLSNFWDFTGFCITKRPLKVFLEILHDSLGHSYKKLSIFTFLCQFLRPKTN